ncbi:MAG TPA: hypothetical protein VEL28_08430 [Candidatus Binatia bacterium]|nr:hypothetical protein [Candidatus Binatia bacterium]
MSTPVPDPSQIQEKNFRAAAARIATNARTSKARPGTAKPQARRYRTGYRSADQ